MPDNVTITLDQLIDLCIEKEASDIHFGEGGGLALRVHGKIAFLENAAPLTKEQAEGMAFAMLSDPKEQERFKRIREIDFSYIHKNGVPFRVNLFYRSGRIAAVMRMIGRHAPSMEELGIPPGMQTLLSYDRGLILVTGTAGSGKSTSMQAMLNFLNERFVKHILTIENPIETIFENKKSIFSQREVGKDTLSFLNGLQSAVHEDANVVMVSDLKSMEVADAVLELAETGHLVIAPMSTSGATQTLSRFLSFFPLVQQAQIRERVADNLRGALSQTLVPRADGKGRIGVFEFLTMNKGIEGLIRRGELRQLHAAMDSAVDEGMLTLDNYAAQLAENGLITTESLSQFKQEEE
ncbi:PilT/PilU family type 4a pilus ATPase [Candidatus Peregrinibacteria bacterium]|nr:PilT/PilU family type 4a pilus ATPase [Candidatus Peregrinibacteria bacterium]